jgi:uncharacterized tellurite resistance protein B-like protein
MSIASLSNVLKFFGGGEPSDEERQSLFKEALLMTLARVTDADSNVSPVEVVSVQTIVERETGETVADTDIRVAAASEIYESAPLDSYLTKVGRKLTARQRSAIVCSLSEVIKSDVKVTEKEVQFFNMVTKALGTTAAETAGLVADSE